MFHTCNFLVEIRMLKVQYSSQKEYLCAMESDMTSTVAFTGHRSYDGSCDDSLRSVVRYLWERGFRTFLTGMAVGFDLSAGECVQALRSELDGLRLVCVVPFAGQERRFPREERLRYMRLLSAADEVRVLAETYSPAAYHLRNDYLVEHSSVLVAWYDGSNGGTSYTVHRAARNHLPVINLWRGLFDGTADELPSRDKFNIHAL